MNIIQGLQEEIKSVNNIIEIYEDPELNGAGMFAASLMKADVSMAENAIAFGDTVGMIRLFNTLKEYHE